MNSYERVMTVFQHQEPDRIPLIEMSVSDQIVKAFGCQDLYEFQSKYYDGITVRIAYRTLQDDGTYYQDEWGITYKYTQDTTGHSYRHPIQRPDDSKKLVVPTADDPYRYNYLEKAVKAYKGKKAIIFSTRAMFLWAVELCGMENLMVHIAWEPQLVEEMLDKIVDNQILIARKALSMGADMILETDDYAFNTGPLISPAAFDALFARRLKRYVDAIHEAGGYMIKHSDGNIAKLLPSIVDTGIDAFQSVDPIAGMDLAACKKQYGDQIVLWGNLDCGDLLSSRTQEDVKNAVIRCIRDAAHGGGYILSTSNAIPASAKPENVQAILDAAQEFGAYPIHLPPESDKKL